MFVLRWRLACDPPTLPTRRCEWGSKGTGQRDHLHPGFQPDTNAEYFFGVDRIPLEMTRNLSARLHRSLILNPYTPGWRANVSLEYRTR